MATEPEWRSVATVEPNLVLARTTVDVLDGETVYTGQLDHFGEGWYFVWRDGSATPLSAFEAWRPYEEDA